MLTNVPLSSSIQTGFMGFVASLKKNYLRRQFSLFGWVHMTLLVIVFSSHFIVNNILEVSLLSGYRMLLNL